MTFPGPTPAYSNPPIQPQNYKPRRFVIEDITLGQTTTITTTTPMDYVIGQLVKLEIPKGYGSVQLDGFYGYVESIPFPDEVILNIDSSLPIFNEYISFNGRTKPQIIAVGDINSGVISQTGRNIYPNNFPGAFINIS